MASLEKDGTCSEQSCSYSWWWDSHNRLHHQSSWLQATLSDLDKKIKEMLNLIEDNGDSFAKRAEMYYRKRPELIKMVEELHGSYRCLAEKYDQLLSESTLTSNSTRPVSSSSKQIQHLQLISSLRSSTNSKPDPSKLKPISEIEIISAGPSKKSKKKERIDQENCEKLERAEKWNELRVTLWELIEDHLRQQAELVRRNEEKRKAIKTLRVRIDKLTEENRALKSRPATSTEDGAKRRRSQLSRIKDVILGKLLP
ncbi:hypothetical protein NMG60_11030985 [Bertholletia excelsa]